MIGGSAIATRRVESTRGWGVYVSKVSIRLMRVAFSTSQRCDFSARVSRALLPEEDGQRDLVRGNKCLNQRPISQAKRLPQPASMCSSILLEAQQPCVLPPLPELPVPWRPPAGHGNWTQRPVYRRRTDLAPGCCRSRPCSRPIAPPTAHAHRSSGVLVRAPAIDG